MARPDARVAASRPEHLQRLYWQAMDMAEHYAGRPLFTPDDDQMVLQHYAALRHHACMEEIEAAGITRMMTRLYMTLPPPRILRHVDGRYEVQPAKLPDDLPEAAQDVWRKIVELRDGIIARFKDPE